MLFFSRKSIQGSRPLGQLKEDWCIFFNLGIFDSGSPHDAFPRSPSTINPSTHHPTLAAAATLIDVTATLELKLRSAAPASPPSRASSK